MTEPAPRPLRAPRAGLRRHEVVDRIKDYILVRHLQPGDPLPTESELCAAIGAGRSSVREAIKTLSALDIAEVRHGHGTYVGRMSLAALVESLAFRSLLDRSDDHNVLAELVEVRQMLEQGLAAPIIAAMDDHRRDGLAELARQMRSRATQGEDFIEEDRAFHLLLVEPLGNDLVVQLTGAFWDVHAIVAPSLDPAPVAAMVSADVHLAMVDAVTDADADRLRRAIAEHYAPVRARIAAFARTSPAPLGPHPGRA